MLQLYNSLSRKKEPFQPLSYKTVKMYVCGITPYDTTHLGHAFVYVSADVFLRYLMFRGYHVEYTQNVTDIDDDILRRAKQEKKDWRKLGDFWTKKFLADMRALNVFPPTHYVKATDSIETIIKIIQTLEEKGFAYTKKGTVYFRKKRFVEYGKLSSYAEQQMLLLSKERGANPGDPQKEDPLDFVLWQKTQPKADQPLAEKGTPPFWQSPWGKGRPGWHIECSAMIYDYLGEQIDVHGGGHDLIYPHHESEIAQSESFTGKKPFVKYWMHTAMVMYQGEKMSKSLGNLIMISELLKKYSANAIRYVLLSHHYRSPWEFEEEELICAERIFNQIKNTLGSLKKIPDTRQQTTMRAFIAAMDNDMDTPQALQTISQLTQRINRSHKSTDSATLKTCLEILGFNLL